MRKFFLVICLITISFMVKAQSRAENEIRASLAAQTECWNKGDLECFMNTYWKNDSLMFIGKSGVNRGWQKTFDNYKRGYPDKTAMGTLSFDIITVRKLSSKYYYVVGKWMLKRSIGDLQGHYDLLFRKINGQWLIVSDHSS